jgi:hypothetical protein
LNSSLMYIFSWPLEILLPSVLNNLKEQKSFVFRVSDGMGMNIRSSK